MSTPTDVKPGEAPEPVEEPAEPTQQPLVQWTDADGKVHVDHPVHTECANGCYQGVTP
ncbi:hypothetical protein AB0J55_28010 [Amycolatopsis sp. NPDC049688]|uniref:hypothetical protein n=1 Tax=Amycolatopsis sp. NPDC049688 TaxID=3154733 RepID=UPI00341B7759